MEFRRLWDVIWRRKWIVIITFSIFFATVVIGTNIATPIYEAKARILIETSDTLSSLTSTLGVSVPGFRVSSLAEDTYDTEIALATIRPILEKVISKLNLKDKDGETLKPEDLIEFSILYYIFPQPYIEVEQYEESDILEIISNSADPQEAANMSNLLAELYIQDTLERARKEYKAARVFLESQIKDVKEKYYKALLAKKDFMIRESTVDLQTETRNLLDYISDLKNEYRDNEISLAEAEENIKLIEKKIAGKGYISSTLIDDLETRLNELMIDIAGKSVEITEEHPDIVQLNKQIDVIKNILQKKADIVLGSEDVPVTPVYEDLIRDLKNAYLNKKIGEVKRNLLKHYMEKAKNELIKVPYKSTTQSQIDLSLSVYQDTYRKLLEYLTQVGVAESITLSNIRLIEPATTPDEPDFPKKILNYALGIFMGLFWALFLAFLVEYVDNTIKTPEDLKDYNFTLLGSIPKFKKKSLISELDANDPVYEAYRRVLSSIHFIKQGKPPKTLLISSANPKVGSTTTLANLGIVYAKEGEKVLLVDTDLRRPHLHQLFGLSNQEGLTSVLLENKEIERVIYESGIEGLNILPSGPTPSDTALLLKSSKMQEIIRELEKRYDILIFDSAPFLIKNDAMSLIKYLEGMVIVLRNKITTYRDISKIEEILKNAKTTPIGVILNCV